MACGGSCCKSGEASTSSTGRRAQEQSPARTAALPVSHAPNTLRSSSDTQDSLCIAKSCCSPGEGDASVTSQPDLHVSSIASKVIPSVTKEPLSIAFSEDCFAKKDSSMTTAEPKSTSAKGCCSKEPTTSVQPTGWIMNNDLAPCSSSKSKDSREEDCCSKTASKQCCGSSDEKFATTINALEVQPGRSEVSDLEKGAPRNEHVTLSVSGMTCTGCETKLQRTLATLPFVSKLRTSLILARAEFDIDNNTATVEDVVKHLTRTTEFKCEAVTTQGSSIDIVCNGRAPTLASSGWPKGVLDIRVLDNDTIRVAYDPNVVGARDLIRNGWENTMQLAPIRPDPSLDAGRRHVWHTGLLTLLSACLTIPVLIIAWAPLPDRQLTYSSASLALATIVQLCIAGPFYPKALKALVFSRVVEMDLLIVLSTTTAYVFSVVSFGYMIAGEPLSTGEFFETSTLLVTLIMVGRWVASLARQKAAASVSIRSLQTPFAILPDCDGSDKEVDARLLQFGDIFKVAPDTQIPTDGTVIEGSSEVDEATLTGESMPVVKEIGSSVIAGSVNGSGLLKVRLTRLPGNNTITTIASMVDEAKLSRPRIQDIADKVANYFVPVVVVLTVITFVIWVAIGVNIRKQSGSQAAIEAITYAITVLIVSCPCAIGLAVPMVVVVATGVAARHGVIFKSAASIEVGYKTTDVVLDKTGTLTLGQLQVVEEASFLPDASMSESVLLGLLCSIKHPVSAAIASHLVRKGVLQQDIQNAKAVTGSGVEGSWHAMVLRAGNSRWLNLEAHPLVRSLLSKGLTVTCFSLDGDLAAIYGLQDSLRMDTPPVISELQRRNIAIHLISGDDDGAVQSVASQLSIPPNNVRSRCSPADKRAYVEALQAKSSLPRASKKAPQSIVVFVGDGTNDAAALAQATIGVHISSGTDIAQSAADVVLIRSDLTGILTLLAISKKAMRTVSFNFGWSFFYNLFAVLLGGGAFVNARIPPEFAGLGELASVLPVIAAAVLLRWSKV